MTHPIGAGLDGAVAIDRDPTPVGGVPIIEGLPAETPRAAD